MKGLRKVLTPFAPDQSGAVSALFEMGGILVICDAGGCTGNICGFDEPRWFHQKSAVFSAGLRDMDAILGRDERLIAKLADVAGKVDASFAAVIGTPVPAVIGTDYRFLKRKGERITGLPVLALDCNGVELYDKGAEKAFWELFRTFAVPEPEGPDKDPETVEQGRVGVLGLTPLDTSDLKAAEKLTEILQEEGWQTVDTYGMGAGLDRARSAGGAERNLVVAPAGLRAAEYLKEIFGTPFEVRDPLAERWAAELPEGLTGKRVLVADQQVSAASIRKVFRERGADSVVLGSWFMTLPSLEEEGDVRLREEEEWEALVRDGGFDLIVADPALRPLSQESRARWIERPQFAVSGRMR